MADAWLAWHYDWRKRLQQALETDASLGDLNWELLLASAEQTWDSPPVWCPKYCEEGWALSVVPNLLLAGSPHYHDSHWALFYACAAGRVHAQRYDETTTLLACARAAWRPGRRDRRKWFRASASSARQIVCTAPSSRLTRWIIQRSLAWNAAAFDRGFWPEGLAYLLRVSARCEKKNQQEACGDLGYHAERIYTYI